jgi:uncharacterized protein YecE (DUF72 family)
MLQFYAQHLPTVEINNSFYHLPTKESFRQWKEQTPADFVFAVKASRYITHMKKLKDPTQSVSRFLAQVEELGQKLGPILFQLPPRWGRDAGRLADFLEALPQRHQYAFECRDASWFHADIYSLLKRHNAAFCVFDLAGKESPRVLTADWGYLRLHGPAEQKYGGCYSRRQMLSWIRLVRAWLAQGAREVFVYFDNDQAGYAARNAVEFNAMASSTGEQELSAAL